MLSVRKEQTKWNNFLCNKLNSFENLGEKFLTKVVSHELLCNLTTFEVCNCESGFICSLNILVKIKPAILQFLSLSGTYYMHSKCKRSDIAFVV